MCHVIDEIHRSSVDLVCVHNKEGHYIPYLHKYTNFYDIVRTYSFSILFFSTLNNRQSRLYSAPLSSCLCLLLLRLCLLPYPLVWLVVALLCCVLSFALSCRVVPSRRHVCCAASAPLLSHCLRLLLSRLCLLPYLLVQLVVALSCCVLSFALSHQVVPSRCHVMLR